MERWRLFLKGRVGEVTKHVSKSCEIVRFCSKSDDSLPVGVEDEGVIGHDGDVESKIPLVAVDQEWPEDVLLNDVLVIVREIRRLLQVDNNKNRFRI